MSRTQVQSFEDKREWLMENVKEIDDSKVKQLVKHLKHEEYADFVDSVDALENVFS